MVILVLEDEAEGEKGQAQVDNIHDRKVNPEGGQQEASGGNKTQAARDRRTPPDGR